jgi:hypothetical protein
MDDHDPTLRPMPAALWLGLIIALALIFAASFTRPAGAEGAAATSGLVPAPPHHPTHAD